MKVIRLNTSARATADQHGLSERPDVAHLEPRSGGPPLPPDHAPLPRDGRRATSTTTTDGSGALDGARTCVGQEPEPRRAPAAVTHLNQTDNFSAPGRRGPYKRPQLPRSPGRNSSGTARRVSGYRSAASWRLADPEQFRGCSPGRNPQLIRAISVSPHRERGLLTKSIRFVLLSMRALALAFGGNALAASATTRRCSWPATPSHSTERWSRRHRGRPGSERRRNRRPEHLRTARLRHAHAGAQHENGDLEGTSSSARWQTHACRSRGTVTARDPGAYTNLAQFPAAKVSATRPSG